MKGELHFPDRVWFLPALAATVVVAVVAGWLFYRGQVAKRSFERSLSSSAREELAALSIPAAKTAEIERTWVAEGFSSEYLVAPVGPMPCAGVAVDEADPDVRIEQLAEISDREPDNLLVAQTLGTVLIENGRYPEAETVLTRALERSNADETIIRAARVNTALDLDDVAVSTVIHVHHALGVARLSQSASEPPWVSLKNVIGSVKPLSQRRLLGSTRGQPAWSKLLIAAPGCARGGTSLSTYDLFNNLVVGYMRGKFAGTAADRNREFARPRKNYPGGTHKLLLVQVERARRNQWQNEAQLWALSNVEQIIDWRMPEDARLALNSVQVIDWWTTSEQCPVDVCTPELSAEIQKVRDQLVEQVFRRRNVAEEQRAVFARGAVRSLATSTLDRARVADAAASLRDWLPASERRTLDDLIAADTARRALPKWLFDPEAAQEPPHARLGPRADAWYAAAMTDLATAVSQWAVKRSPGEQRAALIATRQFLGAAEAPPALVQLERQRTFLDRVRMRIAASKPLWAIIAILLGAVVWVVLVWIVVHVREALLLRVSLYNVEHEYLAGIERDPGASR